MAALQASDLSAFPMMGALLTMMGSGQEFQSPDIKFASAPQASTSGGAAPAAAGVGKGGGAPAAPGSDAGATNAAQGLGIAQPNTAIGGGSDFASIMAENISMFLGGGFGDQGGPGNPGGGQPGSAGPSGGLLGTAERGLIGQGIGAIAGPAGALMGPAGLAFGLIGSAAQQGMLGPAFGPASQANQAINPAAYNQAPTPLSQSIAVMSPLDQAAAIAAVNDAVSTGFGTVGSSVKGVGLTAAEQTQATSDGDPGSNSGNNPGIQGSTGYTGAQSTAATSDASAPGDPSSGGGGSYGADIGGGSSRGSEGGGSGEP